MNEFDIMPYEEFKNRRKVPKYFGDKCFVAGCDAPAEYEGGDARFYCGVCEKHARVGEEYELYVMDKLRRRRIREMWSK